ncbi:MAG: hypothetical protein P8080_13545 [Gammaproteobacteria bacterium]
MASLKTALALVALLGVAAPATADVLIIDKLEQAPRSLPDRGTTMSQVQARYGAPVTKVPAVGDPPISRWEYPDFVVYFEYSHVVHSVEKRERAPAS